MALLFDYEKNGRLTKEGEAQLLEFVRFTATPAYGINVKDDIIEFYCGFGNEVDGTLITVNNNKKDIEEWTTKAQEFSKAGAFKRWLIKQGLQ